MRKVLLLSLLVLVSCTKKFDQQYSEVGNGGDFVEILAEEGRFYAASVVNRITSEKIRSVGRTYLASSDLETLLNEKDAIESDIRGSEYRWVEKLPAGCPVDKCACAQVRGVVFFQKLVCEKTLRRRQDAARLVTHESLHRFFGDKDEKVLQVGATIFGAWSAMGHPDSPHWKIFRTPEIFFDQPNSVWDGKELMIWDAKQAAYYDPARDSWRVESSHTYDRGNELLTWPGALSSASLTYFVNQKILRFTDSKLHGRVYDPARKNWSTIERAPLEGHWSETVVPVGKRVLVWTGENCVRDQQYSGALYDPSTEQWTPIKAKGPDAGDGAAAVWTGNKLILWSGADVYGMPTRRGGMYDPAVDKWTTIAHDGEPSLRMFPSSVWTGKEMLVYGGLDVGSDGIIKFATSGGAFNPSENRWRKIRSGPVRKESTRSKAFWIGTQMLYASDSRLNFYDPFHDHWSDETSTYPSSLLTEQPAWSGMELIYWDRKTNTGYLFYP